MRAVPFDATSLEVSGNPVSLIEGIAVKANGAADFSISDNGRLVYALGAGVRRCLWCLHRTTPCRLPSCRIRFGKRPRQTGLPSLDYVDQHRS